MVHAIALIALPIIVGLFVIRKYRERQWGECKSKTPLTGRVFLITGSNSGIGKEAAKSLAERNASVIMACRNMGRARTAVNDIRQHTSSGTLIPMELDLASLHSVRKFATEVLELFPEIHVLVNNAGVYYPITSDEKTFDGHEMNFGINHLGHFLLTNLLLNRIKESAPSRIVIVSSGLHEKGTIDIDDLDMERRKKEIMGRNLNAAYCASKLANVYHARELSQRLRGTGVDVFALCPGFTYTNIFRNSNIQWWFYIAFLPVAFFYMRSSRQGAQTLLHCATEENISKMSGEFFRNCQLYKSGVKFDLEIQKELWKKSEELTNSVQNIPGRED